MLPRPPWYKRVQFQVWINYQMFPYSKNQTVREWAFDPSLRHTFIGQEITNRWQLPESSSWDVDTYSLDHSKDDHKFYSNVFWVAIALRILGLDFGVGLYYRGQKY